jgi:hypothetical protein
MQKKYELVKINTEQFLGSAKEDTNENLGDKQVKPVESIACPIILAVITLICLIIGIPLLALYSKYDPYNSGPGYGPGPTQEQRDQRPALLISGAVFTVLGVISGIIFGFKYCECSQY